MVSESSYALLSQAIAPQCTFIRAWAMHGGLSAQSTVLEVILSDGFKKKYIVRRPPPWVLKKDPKAANIEYNLLQNLQAHHVPVPKPVFLDQDGAFLGTPSLAVEYIEGATDFSPVNLKNYLEQMAHRLFDVHQTRYTSFSIPTPQKDSKIFVRNASIEYSLEELRARDFLEPVWPLSSKNDAVLVHGDFWPGNLLWQDGKLVAVIDWEATGINDPLLDIAIARLDILWLFGQDAMTEFTEIYHGLAKIDFTDLPYWDLWASTRTAGKFNIWASVYPGLGRPDVTEATMRDHHAYFVHQALGELE